jgi:hypothetical protein
MVGVLLHVSVYWDVGQKHRPNKAQVSVFASQGLWFSSNKKMSELKIKRNKAFRCTTTDNDKLQHAQYVFSASVF